MKTREDKIYSFFGHLIMTILTLLAIIPILFTIFGYIFIYDKLGGVLFSVTEWILFSAGKVEYLCL